MSIQKKKYLSMVENSLNVNYIVQYIIMLKSTQANLKLF